MYEKLLGFFVSFSRKSILMATPLLFNYFSGAETSQHLHKPVLGRGRGGRYREQHVSCQTLGLLSSHSRCSFKVSRALRILNIQCDKLVVDGPITSDYDSLLRIFVHFPAKMVLGQSTGIFDRSFIAVAEMDRFLKVNLEIISFPRSPIKFVFN